GTEWKWRVVSVAVRSRNPSSLHHDLAGHLRMDRAVVGVRSRFSERVRELFVRIAHLGVEQAVCADHRMGNIITVGPGNCSSDGYRDRLRPKTEIVDFYFRVCCGGLVIRRDAR